MALLSLLLFIVSICYASCVDLQFERPDSGFFLKTTDPSHNRHEQDTTEINELVDKDAVMDIAKFTVLDSTRPALIRATYGPFSTKQTVPSHFLYDYYDEANMTQAVPMHHQLEISAHLVAKEVTKSTPTLRVLIHAAGARGHHSPNLCVTVFVKKNTDSLSASCTPRGAGETGGDATCLVNIGIPPHWWPPHTRATVKLPRTAAAVSYMVGTASGRTECSVRDSDEDIQLASQVTLQPETSIGEALLTLDPDGYEEVSSDPLIHVLVPKVPLRPGTVIHAPLYLHPPGNLPALAFVIKCKVKGGIRISGVQSANPAWNLTIEFKSRKSVAWVTALLADPIPNNETLHTLGLHEVFSWVLEVPTNAEAGDSKVTWSLHYKMDANQKETFAVRGNRKVGTVLHILKDDIQAVIPVAKSWSIVNTAVLTGKQVSRSMKVLVVSQAGKIADVTLQSSCNCTDVAALKVSTSCTSVYLDGSEVRGSHNATIVSQYGQKSGSASFTVWMPDFPLTVHIEEPKLLKIRGWQSPKNIQSYPAKNANRYFENDLSICSNKYQQAAVEVYGQFVAVDDNSGRQSYLLSRNAKLRVTEIVTHLLRVGDTSVATIVNNVVKGKAPGRTDVQVLSPITGRVIGGREIRVSSDEAWVTKLHAKVISGLSLSLQPDPQNVDVFTAVTTISPTLTAKYQEGLVDIWIEMSNSVVMPIKDISVDDYELNIRSLSPDVIAVAPSPRSSQPRVIAIGQGEGDFLQIYLETPQTCGVHKTELASTVAHIKVQVRPDMSAQVHFGDEHHQYPENNKIDQLHLSELPIADAAAPNHHYVLPEVQNSPAVQARMNPDTAKTDALEVGMYALLGVFGVVVIIFAGSCIAYSGVGRVPSIQRVNRNDSISQDSVANAHDWVWLGKATLERASGMAVSPSSSGTFPLSDLNGNNNAENSSQSWRDYHRLTKGYESSCLANMNIISNPSVELEPLLNESMDSSDKPIDSATYTKPSKSRKVSFNRTSIPAFFTNEDRPPIPPQRNMGVTANLNRKKMLDRPAFRETGPPPIPPHGINVTSNPFESSELPLNKLRRSPYNVHNFSRFAQLENKTECRLQENCSRIQDEPMFIQQESESPDNIGDSPKFIEVNADDFVRLRGVTRTRAAQVRRATILENPLLSATLPDNVSITDHMENLPPSMDYNQLLDYFSNLKESNA